MADEREERATLPPYLPYKTFKGYLESLRTGIPGRIDRSIMRNRSGAEQSQLIGALRHLGLITADGTPTDGLRALVKAQGDEQKKLLHDLLVMRYTFLFADGFDLRTATPNMVQKAFASMGMQGETIRKAVTFFLAAAKDVGIDVSPYVKPPRETSKSNGARKRRQQAGDEFMPADEVTVEKQGSRPRSTYEVLIGILDPTRMDDTEQQAVWTLIRYLKKVESNA